jgi:hypothetical protein
LLVPIIVKRNAPVFVNLFKRNTYSSITGIFTCIYHIKRRIVLFYFILLTTKKVMGFACFKSSIKYLLEESIATKPNILRYIRLVVSLLAIEIQSPSDY